MRASVEKRASSPGIRGASLCTDRALHDLADPLFGSLPWRRLCSVTFLGVLSRRHASAMRQARVPPADDGTRGDHSKGVAALALDVARHLGLSRAAEPYAAAWGLLHDVATWPFSHSSEPAFARLTCTDTRSLRRMMITGDHRLPAELTVERELRQMGVLPERLLALFDPAAHCEDRDLRLLRQVVCSRLTPDTLEGIARSGRAFGISVPGADSILRSLGRRSTDVTLDRDGLEGVVLFWQAKARVYEENIHDAETVALESRWALAVERALRGTGLVDSLCLTEQEIQARVQEAELPAAWSVHKFRPPLRYIVCGETRRRLSKEITMASLDSLLCKVRISTTKDIEDGYRGAGHASKDHKRESF